MNQTEVLVFSFSFSVVKSNYLSNGALIISGQLSAVFGFNHYANHLIKSCFLKQKIFTHILYHFRIIILYLRVRVNLGYSNYLKDNYQFSHRCQK